MTNKKQSAPTPVVIEYEVRVIQTITSGAAPNAIIHHRIATWAVPAEDFETASKTYWRDGTVVDWKEID